MAYADLHCHTDNSVLDGMHTGAEAAAMAAELGITALAITDHGNCFGHVQHQRECLRAGTRPVFGMEAYFRPDRLARPAEGDAEARKRLLNGDHIILLAQGDKGLRDLWAASTESFATGFYGKPRIDWDILEEYGSDLIVTTACLGGVISQDLLAGRLDEAFATLDRLRAIMGDRLLLEMQANDLPDQVRLNSILAVIAEETGLPLIVASDAHYSAPGDKALHDLWMRCQSGKGKEDYWHFSPMMPEDRIRQMLGYLDPRTVERALRNTEAAAERCTARIDWHADPPVFTKGGTPDDDARRLREVCEANWDRIRDPSRAYRDRMESEFQLVAGKGLAGCYLIVEDICRWVRSQGWLIGPGRGSAAGSLMSYLCDITSVDPLRADLMFERFLTPGRASLPDFDMDFASSKRGAIQDYGVARYGADCVVRVGTTMRYGAKGILNKLFSVLAATLPDDSQGDAKQLAKLIDEAEAGTAGLGLPWEEIIADQAIAEYARRYAKIFAVAGELVGRTYAVGQHPAGLIISPGRPLAGMIPMRTASRDNPLMVTQWDYRAADDLGLLKLDFLTLRTLDSLQVAIELVAERTGSPPDMRSWDVEHGDPQVYDKICDGETAGMFQVETGLCTAYARRMRPRDLNDLSDLTTLIRPGPRNSGAAESYLRRRAGTEEVEYPHPLLAGYLQRSQGVMAYQEDILRACRVLAGYDDLEADGVRKILGKKLTDKIAAAGEEFTTRCVARGHDEAQARELWAKMAEFGKYAFNRAHAYSYAVLTYWTAWLRTHYPVEMITAILSTLDDMDRMAGFATDARREGITVLPPDVQRSGGTFTREGLVITYGLAAIPGVGPAAIRSITAGQPYASWEDFQKRSGADAGVKRALARAGALGSLAPSRRGLVAAIEAARDGSLTRCVHKSEENAGPGGLPCDYDWAAEPQPPPPIGKRGLPLKVTRKPPPARCTVACRRYSPPERADFASYPEYEAGELFRMDFEAYGCWMSPAQWERLDLVGDGIRDQVREIALMMPSARDGSYPLAGVLGEVHPARTRSGGMMWWATIVTEVSLVDMACFTPRRDDEPDVPWALRHIRPGTLVLAEAQRRTWSSPGRGPQSGWRLTAIQPLEA